MIIVLAMYPIRLGFAFAARPWLGIDALWLSFPAGMVATMLLAIILYRHGGWKRSRMTPVALDQRECEEFVHANAEPGGAIRPTG